MKMDLNQPVNTILPEFLRRWCPGTWYGGGETIVGKDLCIHQCIRAGQSNWGASGQDEPVWAEFNMTTVDGTVNWLNVGQSVALPYIDMSLNSVSEPPIDIN